MGVARTGCVVKDAPVPLDLLPPTISTCSSPQGCAAISRLHLSWNKPVMKKRCRAGQCVEGCKSARDAAFTLALLHAATLASTASSLPSEYVPDHALASSAIYSPPPSRQERQGCAKIHSAPCSSACSASSAFYHPPPRRQVRQVHARFIRLRVHLFHPRHPRSMLHRQVAKSAKGAPSCNRSGAHPPHPWYPRSMVFHHRGTGFIDEVPVAVGPQHESPAPGAQGFLFAVRSPTVGSLIVRCRSCRQR